jgi:hypothetical protein
VRLLYIPPTPGSLVSMYGTNLVSASEAADAIPCPAGQIPWERLWLQKTMQVPIRNFDRYQLAVDAPLATPARDFIRPLETGSYADVSVGDCAAPS